jgi:hypothetical protein
VIIIDVDCRRFWPIVVGRNVLLGYWFNLVIYD